MRLTRMTNGLFRNWKGKRNSVNTVFRPKVNGLKGNSGRIITTLNTVRRNKKSTAAMMRNFENWITRRPPLNHALISRGSYFSAGPVPKRRSRCAVAVFFLICKAGGISSTLIGGFLEFISTRASARKPAEQCPWGSDMRPSASPGRVSPRAAVLRHATSRPG